MDELLKFKNHIPTHTIEHQFEYCGIKYRIDGEFDMNNVDKVVWFVTKNGEKCENIVEYTNMQMNGMDMDFDQESGVYSRNIYKEEVAMGYGRFIKFVRITKFNNIVYNEYSPFLIQVRINKDIDLSSDIYKLVIYSI